MPDALYYLADFDAVISGIQQRYAALLNAEEHAFIRILGLLSRPARMVYARLCNRKGPFFQLRKLDYPEIGPLEGPVAELVAHRLLENCVGLPHPARRPRLFACFTLPELRAALTGQKVPGPARRTALLEWLTGWEDCAGWMARVLDEHPVISLPESDPWPFLRFLFFGELRDNLSDFVTRALGHVVTESVDHTKLQPRFGSRAEADDAFRLTVLYQDFRGLRKTLSAAELLAWWRAQEIQRDRLADGHVWFDRLVDRLGRRLEREQQAEAALALYATSPVAPARERQARLLIKAGRRAEAMLLLETMQAEPCHPAEAYTARQLLARLGKNSRRSEARQLELQSRVLTLPYTPRSGFVELPIPVEAAVLTHYQKLGWQGVHAENWLWNASFGLLLWDIIYDPEMGGFHSPMQFGPADLYTPDFYRRRAAAIEARLEVLQQPLEALRIMTCHFEAKQGFANPFLGWGAQLPEILGVMLHHVPAAGHAAVLRHMAHNLKHHGRGFLDLFIWNDSDYRFIEIKGEGDQLAPHQFEWLRFFAAAGIKVSVEKVVRPAAEGGRT